jgi:hypothetical protein
VKLCFIISAFRGSTPWAVHCNTHEAERLGLEVAKLGLMPVIPQANTAHFDKLLTDEFWLAGTRELLSRCDAAVVSTSQNTQCSAGAKAEIAFCKQRGIPLFYEDDLPSLQTWLEENP